MALNFHFFFFLTPNRCGYMQKLVFENRFLLDKRFGNGIQIMFLFETFCL